MEEVVGLVRAGWGLHLGKLYCFLALLSFMKCSGGHKGSLAVVLAFVFRFVPPSFFLAI